MPGPSVNLFSWLRPEHVSVTFANTSWPLQDSNALGWLGALAMDFDELGGVFPGMIEDNLVDDMLNLMREQPNTKSDWFPAAQEALQSAAGRDWWWALNLSKRAVAGWALINGTLLRQGINAHHLPYPDWLDACYSLLWQGSDADGKVLLDTQLSMPPRGVKVKRSRDQVRKMLNDFAAD